MRHTQYHPQDIPIPEADDVDADPDAADATDGLVPPEISDDPEHDRLIDPED